MPDPAGPALLQPLELHRLQLEFLTNRHLEAKRHFKWTIGFDGLEMSLNLCFCITLAPQLLLNDPGRPADMPDPRRIPLSHLKQIFQPARLGRFDPDDLDAPESAPFPRINLEHQLFPILSQLPGENSSVGISEAVEQIEKMAIGSRRPGRQHDPGQSRLEARHQHLRILRREAVDEG